MMITLAQASVDASFWIWLGVLVLVVLVGGAVLLGVRRRMFSDETQADFQAGGILEQLRTLRNEGKISKEEYEQTRKSLIAKVSEHKPETAADNERSRESTSE